MKALYNLSIYVFLAAIKITALFGKTKAKKWISGRRGWENKLRQQIPDDRSVIWFQAASMGEFEQARPLIEKMKESKPDSFILLSFFSPSGYEEKKDYEYADFVCYLPLDTTKNAAKFVEIAKPKLAIFVKYEFWFNLLRKLHNAKIKTILISGIFRPNQLFFSFFGGWFKNQLKAFDHFYLQDHQSEELLQNIGYSNCSVVGDTRFDQVSKIRESSFKSSRILSFCEGQKVIIFGSAWKKEEEFAIKVSAEMEGWKLIIAPHEINSIAVRKLKKSFHKKTVLWSETEEDKSLKEYDVLIIDQIGMLSKLYRFAKISFIGGGFGKGIHNVLEPAVYGSPVIFGPNYHFFEEAKELVRLEGAFSVRDYSSFIKVLQILSNKTKWKDASHAASEYVLKNTKATEKIFHRLI